MQKARADMISDDRLSFIFSFLFSLNKAPTELERILFICFRKQVKSSKLICEIASPLFALAELYTEKNYFF